jgi:hypothetical protein
MQANLYLIKEWQSTSHVDLEKKMVMRCHNATKRNLKCDAVTIALR